MSFTKFPNFQNFSLDDATEYLKHYIRLTDAYSDFSLDDLSIWLNYNDDLMICALGDNLVIKFSNVLDDDTTYYSLLGTSQLEQTLDILHTYSKRLKEPLRLFYITQEAKEEIEDLDRSDITIEEDTNNSDYVYNVEDLLNMHGKSYENFRRRINHFTRENKNVQTIEFDLTSSVDREIIENNIIKWSKESSYRNDPDNWELKVIKRHLALADRLPVKAYGTLSDDKLININIFNLPPHEGWLIFNHIKCNYDYPDVYGYAFYNLFLIAKSKGIKWVNFEQDLGKEGLRKIKTYFRPERMLRRYIVTFDGERTDQ